MQKGSLNWLSKLKDKKVRHKPHFLLYGQFYVSVGSLSKPHGFSPGIFLHLCYKVGKGVSIQTRTRYNHNRKVYEQASAYIHKVTENIILPLLSMEWM